ncbi:MAG: O-antigen ligase family protein [Syntrophomonas sp.]
MAIIAASILLGHSYAFYISVLVFAIFITLVWRKKPLPWIFLVSIAAATPIPLFRQQFACNLIFASCFILIGMWYLTRLPKWIYALTGLIMIGFITSAVNWLSGNIVGSVMRQSAYFFNFGLMPLILVPMIYLRMRESRDQKENLLGLLFFLIVPSTLILLAAKLFGTQVNAWQASLHGASGAEGYIDYRLGKVIIDFSRTGVGFILAVLICASTAVTILQVKLRDRLIAGACLVLNVYLLLASGSFGSMLAVLCGLTAMFYAQVRKVKITKVIASVAIVFCMLLLIYGLSPSSTKEYLGKRFEHRVVNVADADRLTLWSRAVDYILEYPMGVGLTYMVGDKVKTHPHNEYLVYAVSYGALGGLAYPFLVVGLLISFFIRRKRIIQDPNALAVYLAGLGVTVAVAVNSMTDNVGVNRWYFNIMWSLIWYCYFCSLAGQAGVDKEAITSKTAIAGTTAARLK